MEEGRRKIERDLMNQEEFEDYIKDNGLLRLITYYGVSKFRSVRRAINRGDMTSDGYIAPKRPFNNRANTSKRKEVCSRYTNELKKRIYENLK